MSRWASGVLLEGFYVWLTKLSANSITRHLDTVSYPYCSKKHIQVTECAEPVKGLDTLSQYMGKCVQTDLT